MVSSKLLFEYLVYDPHPTNFIDIIIEQMMDIFFVYIQIEKRWLTWHFFEVLVVKLEEVVREAFACLFLGERPISLLLTI